MKPFDINKLRQEKDMPCLSITLPTIKYASRKANNRIVIENSLQKALALLEHSAWPKQVTTNMATKLNALIGNIDYLHLQEGLAIFISPNTSMIVPLPFVIKNKVTLGNRFDVRDLLYINQFLVPYFLLAVSKKRVRLLKGSGRDLKEIVNDDFPHDYVEEYEYEHASIASSFSAGLKSVERDKSILGEIRTKAFFKKVDDILKNYIKSSDLLFIAGVEEEIANYVEVTRHARKITGLIYGNYDRDAVHPLSETAWKTILDRANGNHHDMVAHLVDDIGKKTATDGIRDVWKAAAAGKGLSLLLEKDYHITGYQPQSDQSQIFLSPPAGEYKIINDLADDAIEKVLTKGGEVVILEKDELKEFQHIAMRLRYA